MRLRYTPEARNDLRDIRRYIAEDRRNPLTADCTVQEIIKECTSLKQMPHMGAPLSSRTDLDSPYRYLVFKKNIVFCRVMENTEVLVVRILDGRTQFVLLLFENEIDLE